jgi:hypothetical protein
MNVSAWWSVAIGIFFAVAFAVAVGLAVGYQRRDGSIRDEVLAGAERACRARIVSGGGQPATHTGADASQVGRLELTDTTWRFEPESGLAWEVPLKDIRIMSTSGYRSTEDVALRAVLGERGPAEIRVSKWHQTTELTRELTHMSDAATEREVVAWLRGHRALG